MTRRKIYIGVGLAAALLLGAVYFIFDPGEVSWMPQCLFRRLTGYDCAGCGSQRMLHALLHLDFEGAWRANALLLLALPYLIFWFWVEATPRRGRGNARYSERLERLHRRMNSPVAIWIICVLIVVWTAVRNVL